MLHSYSSYVGVKPYNGHNHKQNNQSTYITNMCSWIHNWYNTKYVYGNIIIIITIIIIIIIIIIMSATRDSTSLCVWHM